MQQSSEMFNELQEKHYVCVYVRIYVFILDYSSSGRTVAM